MNVSGFHADPGRAVAQLRDCLPPDASTSPHVPSIPETAPLALALVELDKSLAGESHFAWTRGWLLVAATILYPTEASVPWDSTETGLV
jgi:hypothetical protein